MPSRSRLAVPTRLSGLRSCFDIGSLCQFGHTAVNVGRWCCSSVAFVAVVAIWVQVDRTDAMGVSPLRGAGLLRCASSRCQSPSSRPFGRPSLTRARRHPPRSLARRVSPDCGPAGLAGALAGAAIKAAPSSRCRQPCQAGAAGGDDDSGPFPCPGIAGLGSFTLRVNDARLTNWPAFRSHRCAPFAARRPDRHPSHPPCPMPGR